MFKHTRFDVSKSIHCFFIVSDINLESHGGEREGEAAESCLEESEGQRKTDTVGRNDCYNDS